MKATIRNVVLGACALALGMMGLVPSAVAITLTLDQSSTQYLGSITPDIPASELAEASYINALIDLATNTSTTFSGQDIVRSGNTLCYPTCPDATDTGSVKDESESNTGILVDGFTYLLGKYDADKGGALVWYVADLSGLFDIQEKFGSCGNNSGCDLSHWVLYNPGTSVPEPSTPLLLGIGLVGVALFRRKFLARG